MALYIEAAVLSGILSAVYNLLLRSTKVARQPLLFPRLETTLSSSQWPKVSRVFTTVWRWNMDTPMAKVLRLSAFLRLPLWRKLFTVTCGRIPVYNQQYMVLKLTCPAIVVVAICSGDQGSCTFTFRLCIITLQFVRLLGYFAVIAVVTMPIPAYFSVDAGMVPL